MSGIVVPAIAAGRSDTRVFRPLSAGMLGLIRESIQGGIPNYSAASWLSSSYPTQLAYLLNRIVPGREGEDAPRYTYFTNSTMEALSAVIRLARSSAAERDGGQSGDILLVAQNDAWQHVFDPLGVGPSRALAPGVHVIDPQVFLAGGQAQRRWAGVGLIEDGEAVSSDVRAALLKLGERAQALSFLARPNHVFGQAPHTSDARFDVLIFGESMTGHQMPCGCFMMSRAAQAPWNVPQHHYSYSSTFSGNALVAKATLHALDHLVSTLPEDARREMAEIGELLDARLLHFRQLVRPGMADMLAGKRGLLEATAAEGGQIRLGDGRAVIDTFGGGGCNLRGHVPAAIVREMVDRHEPNHDYVADIEGLLATRTALNHVFPGVSGATASDSAITLAMLANPEKDVILSFWGNYSGKTLISSSLSYTSPLKGEAPADLFRPYYHAVEYIDPFAPDAVEQFHAMLATGRLALVWFELVQGFMCQRIPDTLLEAVMAAREDGGFLIGVDEVLTGMWRTGNAIFGHMESPVSADVVGMAKAVSDMQLPISLALATDAVVQRAMATNPRAVADMKQRFHNEGSAHIALNAIRAGFAAETEDRKQLYENVLQRLQDVAARSELFDEVRCYGNLIRFILNARYFPYPQRSFRMMAAESAISDILMNEHGIFVTQLRIFLQNIENEEALERLVSGLEKAIPEISPMRVIAMCMQPASP